MNKLSEDVLQHCFQQWKIRMERYRDGEYIEGDISILYFFNKKIYKISPIIL
jgi:hypothetical protein